MIGIAFLEDWTLGPGLYSVAFYLPWEQEAGTLQYMVRAGAFYQSLANDADFPIERLYDKLTEDVIWRFAAEGFDANDYREVIREAITRVDPLPG